MADESFPINNLLAIAKSREIQRAMLDEMRGERSKAAPHFLAEIDQVSANLAHDYPLAS